MYWTWCLIAFIIYVIEVIINLSESPIKISNMEKIWYYYEVWHWGYHTDWWTYTWYKKPWKAKKFFMTIWYWILATLLSWVSVIFVIATLIIKFVKWSNKTDKVKEIENKFNNVPMDKLESQHTMRELWRAQWIKEETIIHDLMNILITDYNDCYNHIYLQKHEESSTTVSIVDNLLLYDYNWFSKFDDEIYEYKIEWWKVFQKLLFSNSSDYDYKQNYFDNKEESKTLHYSAVQNWQLLEDEIPEEYNEYEKKRDIEWYQRSLKRNEVGLLTKTLVFANTMPNSSFQKYLKARFKDIENLKKEYEELCEECWFKAFKEKDWSYGYVSKSFNYTIKDKDWKEIEKFSMTEKIYKKYEKLYDKLIEKYWIWVLSIPHTVEVLKLFEEKNKSLIWK